MSYTPQTESSDSSSPAPKNANVKLLSTEGLPTDHHGPSGSQGVSLPDGSKPKYFQNPWKSWRQPTLSDAWTAYQKGAAIALPLHKTARKIRREFGRPPYGHHSHADDDEDDGPRSESDEDEVIVVDDEGKDPRRPDGAITETHLTPIPSRVYIRPEFSVVHEDDEESDWSDPPVEVVSPRWEERDEVDVTWLGHAGVLVRVPWKEVGGKKMPGGCGVLFDPIFSYRCSPSQYVGPARYLDPPCTVAELPPIHVCCISHDHYDHLDYYTILDLWKHHSSTIHFFVPLGLAQWFTASGIPEDRVTELDWWNETILSFPMPSSTSSSSEPQTNAVDEKAALNLKLACTPAQHRSGRGVRDHMTTLWASWTFGVIEAEDASKAQERGMQGWKGFKLYFGGDTGYRYATAPEGDEDAICPAFDQISDLYGPVSFALLPLSTGSSLPFLRTILSISLDQYTMTSSQHCSPGDALELHRIMGSKRTLGMHWGTFCDSDEARGTRIEFGRERRKRGVSGAWAPGQGEDGQEELEKGRFVTANIGETLVIPK